MRRWLYLVPLLLLALTAGCGTGYNNPPVNNGLYGNWGIVMYPTGSQTPVYVFGLAMSQLGNTNFSGASIPYSGFVSAPTNMCINANDLSATATTNNAGNTFSMTVTDPSSGTVITVQGSLSTLSGSYSNAASQTCSASSGTMSMTAQ